MPHPRDTNVKPGSSWPFTSPSESFCAARHSQDDRGFSSMYKKGTPFFTVLPPPPPPHPPPPPPPPPVSCCIFKGPNTLFPSFLSSFGALLSQTNRCHKRNLGLHKINQDFHFRFTGCETRKMISCSLHFFIIFKWRGFILLSREY